LIVVLAELLSDRPDRMDCVSDAAWSSDNSDRWSGLKAGDAGCARGAKGVGAKGVGAGVGNAVAAEPDPDPDPADGNGGISPILCNSGAVGLGTKIELRTSLRPRRVDARFGVTAC
jgi:hypothetical protein